MVAEAIYPHALGYCISKMLMSGGDNLLDLARDHSLEIVSGEGDLPNAVLRAFFNESYLPEFPYSSWLNFPDYSRTRFDNLLSYYSAKADKFYFSGTMSPVVRTLNSVEMNLDSDTFLCVGGLLTADDIGRRITILNGSGVSIIDSIIDTIIDGDNATCRGRATLGTLIPTQATLYNTLNNTIVRTIADVTTTINTNGFSAALAALTSADLGRRITITVGSTVILDSYIIEVPSGTAGKASAESTQSTAVGIATISYDGLILNCASSPDLDPDPDVAIDLPSELLENVINTIAAVLVGEISLAALLEAQL